MVYTVHETEEAQRRQNLDVVVRGGHFFCVNPVAFFDGWISLLLWLQKAWDIFDLGAHVCYISYAITGFNSIDLYTCPSQESEARARENLAWQGNPLVILYPKPLS